ncbi:DoxX family protein [Nocardioides sp. URHA0032]|uniref:DoxX family protein n=1 Tax=Nocardioides sp. URHA0032 TaxID=1380388 RepID=UPI00048F1210|nr:DoxX family protein [Nocardioides sp. URHA0032]
MDANTWLWILAAFLAAIFLGTGALKLTRSREEIVAAGMTWAGAYSDRTLRRLGWAEVIGAVGVLIPYVAPFAAVFLAVVALVELVTHVRRLELFPDALRTLALVVMCVVQAVYRFGPEAF